MKKILYYCDICKKRIRKNQKVWFQAEHQYHFSCKYKEILPLPESVMKRYKFPRVLKEYLPTG